MKWNMKNLNLKDKNTWLILGLFGLLLLVIALPSGRTDRSRYSVVQTSEEAADTAAETPEADDTVSRLETRLEETLSLIDGAGKVRVMITLKDSGEKVVEKDITRRTGQGEAGTGQTDLTQSSVYEKTDEGELPYISNELTPQVEGVLVVAQGGGNSLVKQNILQGVMALFPIEAHKITIVKMSMQEGSDHEYF